MNCFAVLRCGSCRKTAAPAFDIADAPAALRKQAMDESVTELWSAFICASCDYDKAVIVAVGESSQADSKKGVIQ